MSDHSPPIAPGQRDETLPATGGTLAWWATVLLLVATGTLLLAFVFARVYLVGTGDRIAELPLPLAATGVLLVGAVAAGWAHRVAGRGPQRDLAAAGLGAALVVGLVHGVLLAISFGGMGLDISANVDDATFLVLGGFHYMFLLVVLCASAVAAFNLIGSGPLTRPRTSAQVAAALWQALLVAWLLVFAILFLLPRV